MVDCLSNCRYSSFEYPHFEEICKEKVDKEKFNLHLESKIKDEEFVDEMFSSIIVFELFPTLAFLKRTMLSMPALSRSNGTLGTVSSSYSPFVSIMKYSLFEPYDRLVHRRKGLS